jgi:hypothetical protein
MKRFHRILRLIHECARIAYVIVKIAKLVNEVFFYPWRYKITDAATS